MLLDHWKGLLPEAGGELQRKGISMKRVEIDICLMGF